jgi:predicted HAD superfamily Cof-like phosphohydrolase
MNQNQARVRQWMENAQENLPSFPTIPNADVRRLCARLILEEALETVNAMGIQASLTANSHGMLRIEDIYFKDTGEVDQKEVGNGLADTEFVLHWGANQFGLDHQPFFDEVCRSNETKFDWKSSEIIGLTTCKVITLKDGKFCVRDKGNKIMKSPSYSPADDASILAYQVKNGISQHGESVPVNSVQQ